MKINNQEPTVSTKNEEIPFVNVTTVPAVVFIPDNTIKLEISAQILDDNDDVINVVVQTLNTAAVVQARIDGSDWEREFGEYILTDKAREELGLG